MDENEKTEKFEDLDSDSGVVSELFEFLRQNKKLWLIPIIVVLLLVGLLIALGGTSAAPFIYTLF